MQQARDRAVGTDLASCSTCCPESCVGLKITPLQLLSVLAAADPVRVLLSHTRATAPRLSSTCFRWQPEHLVVQPPGTQQQCQGMTVWEQCLVCLKDEDTVGDLLPIQGVSPLLAKVQGCVQHVDCKDANTFRRGHKAQRPCCSFLSNSCNVHHLLCLLQGGETEALKRLKYYLWDSDLIARYFDIRNGMLGQEYSTKFAPWLAAGCLSPRTIYHEVKKYEAQRVANKSTYWVIFELIWRDYFR